MKREIVDGEEHWTITKAEDLTGWIVLSTEAWKPGVKRLSVRTQSKVADPPEFRLLYCPDKFLDNALYDSLHAAEVRQ